MTSAAPDGDDRGADEAATAPTTKVPPTTAEVGQLRIERGLAHARITVRPDLGDLLHGRWRREPAVTAEDGVVTLAFPRRWTRWSLGRGTDQIVLNSSVPWDVTILGGVHDVKADLSRLKLRSLDIAGGVHRLTLVLGPPRDEVPISFRSADRVTIRRPADAQVRLRVRGGASQLQLDDQSYNAIGGTTVLTTGPVLRNFYNVEMHGARRLRVGTI